MSGCHPVNIIEMPVCEHLVELRLTCNECRKNDASPMVQWINEILERVKKLENVNKKEHDSNLKDEIEAYKELLNKCEELRLCIKEDDELENTLIQQVESLKKRVISLEEIFYNISTLEKMIKDVKDLIFHGAETHASILRCEAKIKELEKIVYLENIVYEVSR